MATWKTRRSSSTSSAKRWGNWSAPASCTTTWGHSRPLTRCTVASRTPSASPARSSSVAQPRRRSRPARGRGRRARPGRRDRPGGPTASACAGSRRGRPSSRRGRCSRTARSTRPVSPRAATAASCSRSATNGSTLSASRSCSRPARRWRASMDRCSAIQSTSFADRPRAGRRAASRMSPAGSWSGAVASRSQASAARTPVRSSHRRRPPRSTGTPGAAAPPATDEGGVHAGQHRDLARAPHRPRARRPTASAVAADGVVGARRRGSVVRRGRRGRARARITFGDPAPVVGQQRGGGADHRRRAAVVDLERMVARAGEEVVVADQPVGRGAGEAVDRLVVVAHTEDGQIGRGQQPDEQEVRGREVLELVDQQQPAGALGRGPYVGLGEQDLDGAGDLLVEVERRGGRPASAR